VDLLPGKALKDGDYVFEASLSRPKGDGEPPRKVRFTVGLAGNEFDETLDQP
jgi:hypothetical protein